jgi:hypothetical protein
MISELDETIKQLLIKKGPVDAASVDISFETPKREWSASISKPTVNIYLYDIRENHGLRGTEWFIGRDTNGHPSRKKNASRIDLSYLVTVWATDIGDEHRLLWHVLQTLFRHPIVPGDVMVGELAKQDYPIETKTAQPDGLFSNPSDFWSALDNEIKPSFNFVATVPLDLDIQFSAPEVRSKILKVTPPGGKAEVVVQVAGVLRKSGKPDQFVTDATMVAREAQMTARSDNLGRYSFPKMPEGKHTIEVIIKGKKIKETVITVPGSGYDMEI